MYRTEQLAGQVVRVSEIDMQQVLVDVDLSPEVRKTRIPCDTDRQVPAAATADVRLMIHKLKLSDGKMGRKFADP